MASAVQFLSNVSPRPNHSCTRCAARKVKCDRKVPCTACVRHDVECVFNPTQPLRNRNKHLSTRILTNRIKYYESILQEKGVDPTQWPQSDVHPQPSQTTGLAQDEARTRGPQPPQPEGGPSISQAQVIQAPGRFRLVNNLLWSTMIEQLHDPEDALGRSSNDESDPDAPDDEFDYVLGNELKLSAKPCHPLPEIISRLWQIFIENIDPLTKVLHVPTMRPAIEKASSAVDKLPRGFEAPMFAIYSAAVMSLTDDECRQRLGESRKILLSGYISATKAALFRAKFMGNTSLVVLQALVIHLLAVRDIYEPRAVWSLTGVAVRNAQSMGLDRDGSQLGLPPFETEMRRRIWWLLKTHDFRTAELCGIAKFHDLHAAAESTGWPANVDDDNISPGMASLATDSDMATDAMFICLRYELLKLAAGHVADLRRQGKTSDSWALYTPDGKAAETTEAFKDIEELLETKYLRYCDPSQPLHLMAMLLARCSINTLRFLSHHPRRWTGLEQVPPSERQFVWKICLKLLEQQNMLQSNPYLKRFAWHAPYVQQWHAIIHVLNVLRANPLDVDAEKAWELIGCTYNNSPDMASDMRKPIHLAMANLCLKAYSKRETALQNCGLRAQPIPQFMLQLRQQADTITSKKKPQSEKDTIIEDIHTSNNSQDPRPVSDGGIAKLSESLDSASLKASETRLPPGTHPGIPSSDFLERDPFWFITGFDDDLSRNMADTDMDLDSLNRPDEDLSATPAVGWDQWDTWLAGSNVMQ